MKHITIYFLLLTLIIGLSYSCKKEQENCIITGQLINCDGTPYANKVATMVKFNNYASKINETKITTDGQGYFEFEYPKDEDEFGFYGLSIESRSIISFMLSGNNYRLNALHINPSINVVIKVKAENPYNSNYLYIANTPFPGSFGMYGPFKDTIIGQYNIDINNTLNASTIDENGGKIGLFFSTRLSILDAGVYTDQHQTYETFFTSVCPSTPDTIYLTIK